MNRLTEAGVTAEDKLFATLDPTTRRMGLPGGGYSVISDTVGFIQNLPPQLIAAFRATLEELQDAHLLLHVVDASHPNAHEQQVAVQTILDELGLRRQADVAGAEQGRPADRTPIDLDEWGAEAEDALLVSAQTGFGIGALRARIARRLGMEVREVEVDLPFSAGRLVAIFRREGFLIREEHRTARRPPARTPAGAADSGVSGGPARSARSSRPRAPAGGHRHGGVHSPVGTIWYVTCGQSSDGPRRAVAPRSHR